MILSKSCEYAIRAMVYVVSKRKSSERLSIKDIAGELESPEHFTAKILQTLSRKGLIQSIKGPNGGFFVDEDMRDISLLQVVDAIDGLRIFERCGLGLKNCDAAHPCPLHHEYKQVRDAFFKMMQRQTIQELAVGLNTGEAFLNSGA